MPFNYRDHFPFRVRIRNKILIPFVLISLAATGLGMQTVTRILRKKIDELVEEDMKRSAGTVEAMINNRLLAMENLALVISRMESIGPALPDAGALISRSLHDVLEKAGFEAEVVKPSFGLPSGSYPLREVGPSAVLGLQCGESPDDLRLFAFTAVPGGGGRGIHISEGIGDDFLSRIKNQTGLDMVLYVNGRPFWSKDVAVSTLAVFFKQNSPAAVAARVASSAQVSIGGHAYTSYLFPLEVGGIVSVRAMLLRNVDSLGDWQAAIRNGLILASLWFVLAVILIYVFIIRRITRPIHRLMAAVEQVGRGDFSHVPEIRTRDEIGRLAETFRSMTASLRKNQAELQEATHKIIHQERLASLGQMMAGIMHEIKNPLNSMSIMIKLAEGEDDPVERAAYFATMESEVKRISRTVGQFLNLARRPHFAIEEVDINERVRALLGHMDSMIAAHGIRIDLDLSADVPRLLMDVGHIDQIVYNLVFNSLQAMREGGTLGVSTSLTAVGHTKERELRWYVRLRVTDTGVGIPPEHLEKVFDPFFTSKQAGEGTGLGLSIVKSVLEEYEGRISLASEPGKGTTAEVLFPC